MNFYEISKDGITGNKISSEYENNIYARDYNNSESLFYNFNMDTIYESMEKELYRYSSSLEIDRR